MLRAPAVGPASAGTATDERGSDGRHLRIIVVGLCAIHAALALGGTAERRACLALAIDPAFSKDQKNDESALAVLGADAAGNIYLVDWWAGRVSSAALREQIERLIGIHKPSAIGAESVQAQVWLVEALREMGYPCQKLQPDKDKVRRAENLSIRYQNGTVYHRYQDRDSAFELQLLRFPKGKHDDLVDAAVYAEMLLFRFKGASVGRPRGRIARPSAGSRPKLPAASG